MATMTKRQIDGLKYYAAVAISDPAERRRATMLMRHPSNATKAELERTGCIVAIGENYGTLFSITDIGRKALEQ